jgi:predicted ATP-grasp superfamily ATP-dependent carboligase
LILWLYCSNGFPGQRRIYSYSDRIAGRDHKVLASFTARKRLQYPPLAGTGVVVEALPIGEIVAPSKSLLAALQFHGISEIEYKRDTRDGTLNLIEINPRHWDQHGLGTAVGVNLSEAACRDMLD